MDCELVTFTGEPNDPVSALSKTICNWMVKLRQPKHHTTRGGAHGCGGYPAHDPRRSGGLRGGAGRGAGPQRAGTGESASLHEPLAHLLALPCATCQWAWRLCGPQGNVYILVVASRVGAVWAAEELLRRGADPNIVSSKCTLTPLEAARLGAMIFRVCVCVCAWCYGALPAEHQSRL